MGEVYLELAAERLPELWPLIVAVVMGAGWALAKTAREIGKRGGYGDDKQNHASRP